MGAAEVDELTPVSVEKLVRRVGALCAAVVDDFPSRVDATVFTGTETMTITRSSSPGLLARAEQQDVFNQDQNLAVRFAVWAADAQTATLVRARLTKVARELTVWLRAERERGRWEATRIVGADQTRLTERKRIAYDIHSSIVQELSAAQMFGHALGKFETENESLAALVGGLAEHLRASYEQTMLLLADLRADPGALPLSEELELLRAEFQRRVSLRDATDITLEIPDRTLGGNPVEEVAIRFITREALQNVYEHARAEHATIRWALRDGERVLTVSDDGRGLPGESDGMAGVPRFESMFEYARITGGQLSVVSNGGVCVKLRLPPG